MSLTTTRRSRAATALFAGQSTAHCEPPALSDDFVDDLGALVLALVPGVAEDAVATLKATVRERWGGDRPFIARRAGEGRSERNRAIRADYQRGEHVALLTRRYQLSRMQIYRILGLAAE